MSSVPGPRVPISITTSTSLRKPLTPLQNNKNTPDHAMVGKTKSSRSKLASSENPIAKKPTSGGAAGAGSESTENKNDGSTPTGMSPVNRAKVHNKRAILTRKKPVVVEKGTNTDDIELEEDLINGKPSVDYWKDLAEERRIALADALQENQELMERVEKLETDNKAMEEMLGEAKTLAEMLTTMAEEGADESGIGAEVDDL